MTLTRGTTSRAGRAEPVAARPWTGIRARHLRDDRPYPVRTTTPAAVRARA